MMCYLDVVMSPFDNPLFLGLGLFWAVIILLVVSTAVLLFVFVKELIQKRKAKNEAQDQDPSDA